MKRGFTLIEVMIASVLLVSFMGAYLGTYHSFMSSTQQSKSLYSALSSCLNKLEEISGHDFGSIVADYNTTNFSILDNFGNKIGAGLIQVNYAGSANWTNATLSAGWGNRSSHTSVVYDNKMWVMGGGNGIVGNKNDVWWTNDTNFSDGQTWYNATLSAAWPVRGWHTSVVYDNKMWVIGGYGSTYLNDVWYSVDGKTWYNATLSAGWGNRASHTSVVYDNKMWVIGGSNISAPKNDVWYSNNGVTWYNVTLSAPWQARSGHTSVVYDNKMWVIGGYGSGFTPLRDVWWTNDTNFTDGQTWYNATLSAGWGNRAFHTSVVYDNKMWVTAGGNGGLKKDTWYSNNGKTWYNATLSAPWQARSGHTSVVYDNKMYMMGGWASGSLFNEVWDSTDGNRLLDVRILASFKTPNNRTTGEDENLDGFFNVTSEDKNGNGTYDTPVQLRALVSERKGATFLGRQ